MHSFEDTAKELYQTEGAQNILCKLNCELKAPLKDLSYAERMDTPLELDMTYGDWLSILRDYNINTICTKCFNGKVEWLGIGEDNLCQGCWEYYCSAEWHKSHWGTVEPND